MMRADLESPTGARSSTASSNFVVCSLVNAEHRQHVREDLVCTPCSVPQLAAHRNGDASTQPLVLYDGQLRPKRRRGGNLFQEWFNSKLSTYKRLRCTDDRRLSQEELEAFRAKCADKGAQRFDQEVDQWRYLFRVEQKKLTVKKMNF